MFFRTQDGKLTLTKYNTNTLLLQRDIEIANDKKYFLIRAHAHDPNVLTLTNGEIGNGRQQKGIVTLYSLVKALNKIGFNLQPTQLRDILK